MSETEILGASYTARLNALDKMLLFRQLLNEWKAEQDKLARMNYQSDLVTIQYIMLSDHIIRMENILDA